MASLVNVALFMFVLLHAISLLPSPVHCDEENDLLQGINSYRTAQNVSPLAKHDKAGCVADEIADKLEDQPCTATNPKMPIQLQTYPQVLAKCGVDVNVNDTTDAIALPACVSKLVPTLLLTNYTTRYATYLNDSRFTGAGLGKEDDWMVVVLTTNSPGGSFARGYSLLYENAFRSCLVSLFLGFLLLLA